MNASTSNREASPAERESHPSPHRHRVSRWAIWFGLLGAPVAWSLQELVNVSVAGYACYPHDIPLALPLWPQLKSISAWVEIVALVVCVAAFIVAFSNWRRSRNEKPGHAHQVLESGDGRTRFMAMAGILVSALFFCATVLATINIAGVPPCGG